MVRITEELVRKRAEHNECIIGTLEELSLHQENLDKIEHLHHWCKELEILYLQANIISKIENLNKLKKLKYLNLAINNIEKIENLEKCESLEKLDLTLNFIGDLESVCSLKNNFLLRELYLTGNPCADYTGYREYIMAKLPQLERLDGKEITISERIKAQQRINEIEKEIRRQQEQYNRFRNAQKERLMSRDISNISDEDFWKMTSEHSPETRVEIASREHKKDRNSTDLTDHRLKRQVTLFNKDGRPLNVNQAKLNFRFSDEDPKQFILDIAVYKFLDSNLIEVDLQPIYVKVSIKSKIFQFVFPEEVLIDKSTAQRSQTTGHLVLKLPRANYKEYIGKKILPKQPKIEPKKKSTEYLEVEAKKDDMDFSKIVENSNKIKNLSIDPDIPPLEFA